MLRSQDRGAGISPRHELVDAACGPAIDELRQDICKPSLRIDAVELARLKERRNDRPVFGPPIVAGEEAILAVKSNRAHGALHAIGVDLDAAIVQKTDESVPMVEPIPDRIGRWGFAREDFQPVFEPGRQCDDQRLRMQLPALEPLLRRPPAQGALDGIELGDAAEGFLCSRGGAGAFDLHEAAPQMRPAKGERDTLRAVVLALRIGQRLVGRVPVALYNAGVIIGNFSA